MISKSKKAGLLFDIKRRCINKAGLLFDIKTGWSNNMHKGGQLARATILLESTNLTLRWYIRQEG
jgi:hypothetical protein